MRGRRWGVFGALGAAAAAAITTIVLATSGGVGVAPLTANEFVSASGSDVGANCKRFTTATAAPAASTVCLTWNKAFQLAQSGDQIEVLNGSYGPQTIFPNPSVTTAVSFKPQAAQDPSATNFGIGNPGCNAAQYVCLTNLVKIAASHIEMDGFTFWYQPPASAPGNYLPGIWVTIPDATGSGATYGYACTTDVTLRNDSGPGWEVHNGVSSLNIIGGTWGYIGFGVGQHNDTSSFNTSSIGGSPNYHCPNAATVAAPATDVTIKNADFGNNFQGCTAAAGDPANCQYPLDPCTSTAVAGGPASADCSNPSHADCIHLFGETIGLTIEDNRFDRCFGMWLNLNTEETFVSSHTVDPTQYAAGCDPTSPSCTVWGEIKDATIQDNWFGDATPSDAQTVQILNDSEPTPVANAHTVTVCDNVVFRNNTFYYNGLTSAFKAFALKCPPKAGASVGLQFYSNYFLNSVASGGCTTATPYDTVWDYNVFASTAVICGTNATTTTDPKLAQPLDTGTGAPLGWTYDFHLLAGSPLIGAGSPTNSAPTDCDGNAWSGTPNAGAC